MSSRMPHNAWSRLPPVRRMCYPDKLVATRDGHYQSNVPSCGFPPRRGGTRPATTVCRRGGDGERSRFLYAAASIAARIRS